jgi:hypothetical protein
MSQANMRARSAADRRPAPAVVDFHNAPAAFLPTDFELEDTRPCSRRRRLANRAAGTERWTERSSEKNPPMKPKRTRRLSAQLISIPRTDVNHRLDARTASAASNVTAVHIPESAINTDILRENEKQKNKDVTAASKRAMFTDIPPAKKSSKGKSRIFKFWM